MKSGNYDRNVGVQLGSIVDGWFTKQLPTAMLVSFSEGGKHNRSGLVHVSRFPGKTCRERNSNFRKARVGRKAPGLVVLEATPPVAGGKAYTSVKLSFRAAPEPACCEEPRS